MARVDKLAQWIAQDILRAQGVTRTPDAMASVMPVSYNLASGFLGALGAVIGDMGDELARGTGGQVRHPVPGLAELLAALDFRQWADQMAGEQQESERQEAV